MSVNVKENALEFQFSNAIFCHFLFSIHYFFSWLHTGTFWLQVFLVCIDLCMGHPQQPSLTKKPTKAGGGGVGSKYQGPVSEEVYFQSA